MAVKLFVRDLDDPERCRVEGEGFDLKAPDEQSVKAFGLRRETGHHPVIWEASKYIFGHPPNDMWIGQPTGGQFGGKGYEMNDHWQQPQLRRTFRRGQIVSLDTTPEILAAVRHDNSHSSIEGDYEASLEREVFDTIEVNDETSLSVGYSITVGVELGSEASGVKAKVESTLSTEATKTQGETKANGKTLKANQGVSVVVPPHRVMRSVLYAAFGQAVFNVTYEMALIGDAYFYFKRGIPGKGHHLTCPLPELRRVMRDVYGHPAPDVVEARQRVAIGVFGDSYSALEDVE